MGAEVAAATSTTSTVLATAAAEADGVIHLAFKHERCVPATSLGAVDFRHGGHPGTWRPPDRHRQAVHHDQRHADARHGWDHRSPPAPKTTSPRVVPGPTRRTTTIALGQQGVRSSVVRLAPIVAQRSRPPRLHPRADLLCPGERGPRPTPATAPTSWPAANTHDIVCSTTLALEKAPGGSTLHGVGDTGIPRKVIAETIAGKLGIETRAITSRGGAASTPRLPRSPSAGLEQPDLKRQNPRAPGMGDDPSGLGRGRGDGPLLRADETPASAAGPTDQQHRNPFVTRLWTRDLWSWSSWSRPRPFRSLGLKRRSAWWSTSSWLP